jgi:hypothetical protein
VTLATRGNCVCISPVACFFTDTAFNNKNLLLDSVEFEPDNALYETEKAFYFLQYGKEKKRLRMSDGKVIITQEDIVFKDTSFIQENSPELILGLVKSRNGLTTSTLVTKVSFAMVSMEELAAYYKALRAAMEGESLEKIRETFTTDIYFFFGKPNECQVEKIIHVANLSS